MTVEDFKKRFFISLIIIQGDLSFAIEREVTVVIISCPHALGLATPLVTSVSTSIGAIRGLLIRDRAAFENARKLNSVVFDKTGTLTEGEFGITDVYEIGIAENELLSIAYSVVNILKLSKATYRKMIQNLIWATAYNVVALPLAAGILYNQGIVISPALGAVLMSLSTIIVSINAKLLKID